MEQLILELKEHLIEELNLEDIFIRLVGEQQRKGKYAKGGKN